MDDLIGPERARAACQAAQREAAGMIARYIALFPHEVMEYGQLYAKLGWRITYYGERGEGRQCFVVSFRCCK